MTVNYYYQGEFVSQQTYTTSTSYHGSCGTWYSNMQHVIGHAMDGGGSILPGGDYSG